MDLFSPMYIYDILAPMISTEVPEDPRRSITKSHEVTANLGSPGANLVSKPRYEKSCPSGETFL